MPSFNRVILMGNITRDVELKYLESGTAVADLLIQAGKLGAIKQKTRMMGVVKRVRSGCKDAGFSVSIRPLMRGPCRHF